jgi:predicted O-methyltransferase YrrM
MHNGAAAEQRPGWARALHALWPRRTEPAFIAVSTAPGRWSYALSFPVDARRLRGLSDNDAVIVECSVRVHAGRLGVGLTAEDGSTFVSKERVVSAGPVLQTLRIWIEEPASARHLLFRNLQPDGQPTRFELFDLATQLLPGARRFTAPWSDRSVKVIKADELARLLDWAELVWDSPSSRRRRDMPATAAIEIVDVEDLPSLPEISAAPALPPNAMKKPLADWKMETDDAPILECLWRAWAPSRHLEFGTWEGFGAALVARSTDAEIWTLNLPEGEAATDGTSLYASTDAGPDIGWKYRTAGAAARVHQILADSRDFDTDAFAVDFFDTILIDGGHTPDVVANDTDKALRVLRPGGLCVWHDFCPDPDALSKNLAPLGVVQAIAENIDRWRPLFARLFWIRKSWILVGERKA